MASSSQEHQPGLMFTQGKDKVSDSRQLDQVHECLVESKKRNIESSRCTILKLQPLNLTTALKITTGFFFPLGCEVGQAFYILHI